jgi:hypothetical protein
MSSKKEYSRDEFVPATKDPGPQHLRRMTPSERLAHGIAWNTFASEIRRAGEIARAERRSDKS